MPKGKHNVAELRKHQIMLRLNDSEFAEVSTQAKKFHQPIAVYVRDATLKTSSSVPYQICVDLGDIQSLVTEYSRIFSMSFYHLFSKHRILFRFYIY